MWGGTWIMRLINHLWPARDNLSEQHWLRPSPVLLFNISSINHNSDASQIIKACSELGYNWLSLIKLVGMLTSKDWPPSTIYNYHLPSSTVPAPPSFQLKPAWPGQIVLYVLQAWEPSLGLLQNVKMFLLELPNVWHSDRQCQTWRCHQR